MSDPLSPARLAEIRERLASVSTILPSPSVTFRLHQDGNAMIGGWTDTPRDAEIGDVERFLECARQDLADLLAEVGRLGAAPPRYIVQLEPGVWLAPWRGDPGRTLVQSSALTFPTRAGAALAIQCARDFRPLLTAKIVEVQGG